VDSSRQVVLFRVCHANNGVDLVVYKISSPVSCNSFPWSLKFNSVSTQLHRVVFYKATSIKSQSGTFGSWKKQPKLLPELSCTIGERLGNIIHGKIAVTEMGFRFLKPVQISSSPSFPPPVMHNNLVPNPSKTRPELLEKCRASGPLSLHQLGEKLLLCFRDFGIYANRDDGRLVGDVFQWEVPGVRRVIWLPPHFVLFTDRFIEIRELVDCSIVQIASAPKEQRVVCDGTGVAEGSHNSILITSPNDVGRETLWTLSRQKIP
jgi:hypothetical protein